MTTKYQQTNKENTGIDPSGVFPGYNHDDGLNFDENSIGHRMNEVIIPLLMNTYNKSLPAPLKRILDVGSGAGNLAYFLRNSPLTPPDVEVFTLDGNRETINSPFIDKERHFVVRTDEEYRLVDDQGETIKFDFIISFDHLGHIQPHKLPTFFENIRDHSHRHTLFLGTTPSWIAHGEEKEDVYPSLATGREWAVFLAGLQTTSIGDYLVLPLPLVIQNINSLMTPTRGQPWVSEEAATESVIESLPHRGQQFLMREILFSLCHSDDPPFAAWQHRLASSHLLMTSLLTDPEEK